LRCALSGGGRARATVGRPEREHYVSAGRHAGPGRAAAGPAASAVAIAPAASAVVSADIPTDRTSASRSPSDHGHSDEAKNRRNATGSTHGERVLQSHAENPKKLCFNGRATLPFKPATAQGWHSFVVAHEVELLLLARAPNILEPGVGRMGSTRWEEPPRDAPRQPLLGRPRRPRLLAPPIPWRSQRPGGSSAAAVDRRHLRRPCLAARLRCVSRSR
jgi:hypothetical protein